MPMSQQQLSTRKRISRRLPEVLLCWMKPKILAIEAAVTAVDAIACAIASAGAGELIGGKTASSSLGTFAVPLGNFAGRNLGHITGGALSGA